MHLLLADDHGLFRDSMAVWLKQLDNDVLIDFSDSFKSVTHALRQPGRYDLVMIDLNMPGMQGAVSIKQLCVYADTVPLLVVSADESPQAIRSCIEAGVAGYVAKSSAGEVILLAVRQVLAGEQYFPEVGQSLFLPNLSDKQKQLLAYLAEGHSNKTIAQNMCLSEGTVKQYVTKILRTLNVDNRMQAGLKAKELLGIGNV